MTEATHVAATTLRNPFVRIGVLLPSVATVVYVVSTGTIVHTGLVVAIAGVGLALAVVAVTRPWDRGDSRAETGWQALSGTVGVALAAPFLAVATDIDVQRVTLVFALIVVLGAYTYPGRLRVPLGLWTIIVWATTLWWGGVRDPQTLVLHVGGGLVLLVVCVRTAGALVRALEVEATNRAASEHQAHLLASVLRTNSLEPGEILRAVVTGLVDLGFEAVAIREVDEEAGALNLVDGHELATAELYDCLPLDDAHLSRAAIEGRRTVVADEYDRSQAELHRGRGLRGTVVVPVLEDGHPVAVVTGVTTTGPLSKEQVEAAGLLAEQAGLALERARSYEADRDTVEKLRALDLRTQDFVSTVSHELRTPLTVVQGLGQTLLRRWDDLGEGQRHDLLTRIDANAERLAAMVRSLLDTSAFERGELTLEWRRVSLRAVVDGAVHRLATLTSGYPVHVEVADDLEVRADPALVDHVLENLLLNVTKHTPPGTLTRVVAEPDGAGGVEVAVVDDGPGIPEDDLPHVLDRFYRGGALTTRPSGGLGLGLALARQIVQAHGSDLEVDSRPGEGTTFCFRLPSVDDATPSGGRRE